MRQDWQYFKCDGCGKLFKLCKNNTDLNNKLLICYSVNNKLDDKDFEFCSDNCCMNYLNNKITNNLKTDIKINSFSLWVNSTTDDILPCENISLLKWVDCKDCLPEINQPVLTFDGHCYVVERRIKFIDTDDGQLEGEWWIDGYEGDEFNPIGLRDGAAIKWALLPKSEEDYI